MYVTVLCAMKPECRTQHRGVNRKLIISPKVQRIQGDLKTTKAHAQGTKHQHDKDESNQDNSTDRKYDSKTGNQREINHTKAGNNPKATNKHRDRKAHIKNEGNTGEGNTGGHRKIR